MNNNNKTNTTTTTTTSLHFQAVIGTISGYDLQGKKGANIVKFVEVLKDLADETYKETNVYVSGFVTPTSVYYKTEWGCPEGGEPAFLIQGDMNPQFAEAEAWKQAVCLLMKKLQIFWKQATLTVTFTVVTNCYLK